MTGQAHGQVCGACGRQLEPDSRFCGGCGARVQDKTGDRPPIAAATSSAAFPPPPGRIPLSGPPPGVGVAPLGGPPPPGVDIAQAAWAPPQSPPVAPSPAVQPAFGYQPPYPEASGATAALVLGILGIVILPLFLSIPAIIIGDKAQKQARMIPGQPGLGMARAGYICGIVGTVLGCLGLLFWLVIIIAAAGTQG